MKAIWNHQIIAESDDIVRLEGNSYFPFESVKKEYLDHSKTQTKCPWKGDAHYYHLRVDGKLNENAAWYYPEPKEAAHNIRNRIAFWKGVSIIE